MTKNKQEEDKKPEEEKSKQEEDKKPEEEKSKQGENSDYGQRLDAVEAKVDQILEAVSGEMTMEDDEEMRPEEEEKKKQEEDYRDEENKKKQEEDKKPEEEKRKQEEEEEEEKKKEEGEPKPGEGEVKLPQAAAGETDETAAPEGDKVDIVEKQVESILHKKFGHLVKGKKLLKSTQTPRVGHDIVKRKEERKGEFALDLLKRATEGKISVADMNREVKTFISKNYNKGLEEFFEKNRPKEVA